MARPAPLRKSMLEWAIEQVIARVRRTGETPTDAYARLESQIWPRLTPDDIKTATARGIVEMVHDRLHYERGSVRPVQIAIKPYEIPVKPITVQVHLSKVIYEGADGKMKALIYFTEQDARAAAQRERQIAAGHLRVAGFMDTVADMLATHKVATVGDLPAEVQENLAHLWMQINDGNL